MERLHSEGSDLLEKIAGGDWSDETQSKLDDIIGQFAQDFGFDLDEAEGEAETPEKSLGERAAAEDEKDGSSEEETQEQEETAGAAA